MFVYCQLAETCPAIYSKKRKNRKVRKTKIPCTVLTMQPIPCWNGRLSFWLDDDRLHGYRTHVDRAHSNRLHGYWRAVINPTVIPRCWCCVVHTRVHYLASQLRLLFRLRSRFLWWCIGTCICWSITVLQLFRMWVSTRIVCIGL